MADPVEIIDDVFQKLHPFVSAKEGGRQIIQAIEAAGYRIAGPEPTEEMLEEIWDSNAINPKTVIQHYHDCARRDWQAMFAKLPLYGSE